MHLIVKVVFSFILLISGFTLKAQEEPVNNIPQISLLTCESGDQLYSTFGHSAIRILDPANDIDEIYNYGIFSFRQPNFYLKFVRGKLLYHLGKSSYKRFLAEYHYDKRGVDEQILNLDSLDTYAMIDFLEENYLPENRSYKYDFFFDNCSTRIRDIFERELGVEMPEDVKQMTYRNQLDEKLIPLVWSDFGIDLVIGSVADRISNYRDQMFLPSYLFDQLAKATLKDKTLVKETRNVFSFSDAKKIRNKVPFITPFKVMMAFFSIVLLLVILYRNKASMVLSVLSFTWFLMIGILSLVMLFLWFGTDHIATKDNWNLIWCSPLFLILLTRFRVMNSSMWVINLSKFVIIISGLTLLTWAWFPQQLHVAFIPMILTSMLLLAWRISPKVD